MSFFSDMGFFEKVAFVVASPVVFTAAAAVEAYEGITGKDAFSKTEESNTQNEQEVRARIVLEAKEKRAGEERVAILGYARKGLQTLQTSHSDSTLPIATGLNFYDLKSAVHRTIKPIELVGQWLPQLVENAKSNVSRQEITRLTDEISELKQLRQALLDLQTEDVNV